MSWFKRNKEGITTTTSEKKFLKVYGQDAPIVKRFLQKAIWKN